MPTSAREEFSDSVGIERRRQLSVMHVCVVAEAAAVWRLYWTTLVAESTAMRACTPRTTRSAPARRLIPPHSLRLVNPKSKVFSCAHACVRAQWHRPELTIGARRRDREDQRRAAVHRRQRQRVPEVQLLQRHSRREARGVQLRHQQRSVRAAYTAIPRGGFTLHPIRTRLPVRRAVPRSGSDQCPARARRPVPEPLVRSRRAVPRSASRSVQSGGSAACCRTAVVRSGGGGGAM